MRAPDPMAVHYMRQPLGPDGLVPFSVSWRGGPPMMSSVYCAGVAARSRSCVPAPQRTEEREIDCLSTTSLCDGRERLAEARLGDASGSELTRPRRSRARGQGAALAASCPASGSGRIASACGVIATWLRRMHLRTQMLHAGRRRACAACADTAACSAEQRRGRLPFAIEDPPWRAAGAQGRRRSSTVWLGGGTAHGIVSVGPYTMQQSDRESPCALALARLAWALAARLE